MIIMMVMVKFGSDNDKLYFKFLDNEEFVFEIEFLFENRF